MMIREVGGILMKKLALVLAAAITLSFGTACGGNAATTNEEITYITVNETQYDSRSTSLTISNVETTEGLEALSQFPNLEDLTINYSADNAVDLSFLKQLPALKSFTFLNEECDLDISVLGELTNLESLTLITWSITDISPLENLTNLTSLTISSSLNDMAPISKLTNLRTLVIPYNNCDDSVIAPLVNLEYLDISNNKLSDVYSLYNMKNLSFIDLEGNPIPSMQIEELKHALPSCEINY